LEKGEMILTTDEHGGLKFKEAVFNF